MIYLNVLLTVKDSAHVGRVRELLIEQGRLSRQEPGCTVRSDSIADRSQAVLSQRTVGIVGGGRRPPQGAGLHDRLRTARCCRWWSRRDIRRTLWDRKPPA